MWAPPGHRELCLEVAGWVAMKAEVMGMRLKPVWAFPQPLEGAANGRGSAEPCAAPCSDTTSPGCRSQLPAGQAELGLWGQGEAPGDARAWKGALGHPAPPRGLPAALEHPQSPSHTFAAM